MLKKIEVWIITLMIGIGLIVIGFLIQDEALNTLSGLGIGGGSGLFGMGIANLVMINYEKKHPSLARQNEIDYNDERSVMIRHKAKAKAGDIMHWTVMGLAYIFILVDAPLWMMLSCVAIFVSYTALGLYFMYKYDQEL